MHCSQNLAIRNPKLLAGQGLHRDPTSGAPSLGASEYRPSRIERISKLFNNVCMLNALISQKTAHF